MAKFLTIEQINKNANISCMYDLAFVGAPIDERGQASIEKAKVSAKEIVDVHYDQDQFSLSARGNIFPANPRGFRQFTEEFPATRLLIEATTLEFPEILLLIKAYLSVESLVIGFFYVEPESYEERVGQDAEDLHAFALREGYRNFSPIPGFTPMLSDSRKARLLAFVGFESTRLRRVLVEDEAARIKAFSVVFGVPPFQASWEMHSFMQNANVLKEPAMEEILFVSANSPRSAYHLIHKVARSCCPQSEVMTLAPLGTKPMSIGAALYAAQNSSGIRVIYDYPKTRSNCTRGIGKIHHYVVTLPLKAEA